MQRLASAWASGAALAALLVGSGLVGAAAATRSDDLLLDLERPGEGGSILELSGAQSWRWVHAETQAEDFSGSAGEGDYSYPHGWFVSAGLRAHLRPWRLEAEAATNPAASRPSYEGRFRVTWVGSDSWWWHLAPYLEVEGRRRQLDFEPPGGERDADWRTWRGEVGLDGLGYELAGAESWLYLQRDSQPSLLGFADDSGDTVLAIVDEDFVTWQLGLGFGYDWGDHLAATRRRYQGFYGAIAGETAILWTDASGEVLQRARSTTGKTTIDEPLYYEFALRFELGYLGILRLGEQGRSGWQIRAGYRGEARFLGVDDHHHHHHDTTGSDELEQMWDRSSFEHGPFAQILVRF